ncbi:apolipoL family protein [Helicobacter pylori]|uniref:apolipoL family protein n=1 Tax=Helicobacter pylori TaxID=210 RepID=UPI001E3F0BDA|nr:apolipoL family protein [Helicobacter pylori]
MYERIEKDIGNKECKEIFENEREQGMKELDRTIEGLVKKCEEQFSKDIKEDIEQFEERIKNFLVMLNHINLDSGFDFSFNIDSGINGLGLFASIGGLVILGLVNFWNPMGWIELGLAGLLGLVGVVKSVWSWFSSDYKKSQQRKEVDKNLDKVCGIIEKKMRNQIEYAKKVISENVESLKAGLNDPVVCYECKREGLIKAGEGLWHLSNNIKTRIVQ